MRAVDRLVDGARFRARGWDYVTETSVGTALGAGKLLGLDREGMSNALALGAGAWLSRILVSRSR